MIQTKAIAVLFLAGQILCQNQGEKGTQESSISDFDPQLLNYQLQQLAIQQYSGQQYEAQGSQYGRQSAAPQYAAATQQYDSAQLEGSKTQQLSQQDYDAARILQGKLFEPYQGQFGSIQPQGAQYSAQQIAQYAAQQSAPVSPQPSPQQLSKQSLLGVAYSSAADASKTSFTGYGIKYSF